tara:strand:- start:997 stop:1191 length:195 start_codon:yes stop_codon:yes gene_type:complete
MPLYDYYCNKCDNTVELITTAEDVDLRMCMECGCGMVKRFPTTGKPQFKGSGFYETDYKKKDKQ